MNNISTQYLNAADAADLNRINDAEDEFSEFHFAGAGYYYASCFPGCLPDSEWYGPYATEDDALADAEEIWGDDEEENF